MNPKITNEALEAYCYCAQKFHLKLHGEQGVTTDYERMRAELRAKTMARAIKRYLEKQDLTEQIRLTQSRLEKAPQYLFNGIYEDDHFKLNIDGIHKTTDPHASKSYTLRPIIFSGFLKNETRLRRVLSVYGYALSKMVSQPLHMGLIWNSSDKTTKVSLRVDAKEFSTWLQKLIAARLADSPPPLFLNDHCQVCEFQQR